MTEQLAVDKIFPLHPDTARLLTPFMVCTVAAGFPSPADDHLDNALDLNELMIEHPAATFLVSVKGQSMRGAGIKKSDILVVDRSIKAVDESVIVAVVDGECLVKTFRIKQNQTWLQSAHPDFPNINITDELDFQIWGVVTGLVRKHGTFGRVRFG